MQLYVVNREQFFGTVIRYSKTHKRYRPATSTRNTVQTRALASVALRSRRSVD